MAARSEVVLLEAGGSQGTGFLIAPGLLVTSLHVVAEFDEHGRAVVDDAGLPFSHGRVTCTYYSEERGWWAELAEFAPGRDPHSVFEDWAVLRVCNAEGVRVWATDRAQPTDLKQPCRAFGFPTTHGDEGTRFSGHINGISDPRRAWTTGSVLPRAVPTHRAWFEEASGWAGQTPSGFSGGPVVVDDRVIGIVRRYLSVGGVALGGTVELTPIEAVYHATGIEALSQDIAHPVDVSVPASPKYVFVVHAAADKLMVARLCRDLLRHGVRPWLDLWDLVPGSDWREELRAALADAPAVLVCDGPSGYGDRAPEYAEALRARLERDSKTVFRVGLPGASSVGEGVERTELAEEWDDGVAALAVRLEIDRDRSRWLDREAEAAGVPSMELSPYRGLAAFHETDARWMFGRDEEIGSLLALAEKQALLTVIGASGSGKSSLVMAGLCPALRNGALGGKRFAAIGYLRPGKNPCEELARALVSLSPREEDPVAQALKVAKLRDALRDSTDMLKLVIREAVPGDADGQSARKVVLVVDQLEELFTEARLGQRGESPEAMPFVRNIIDATRDGDAPVWIVSTLRADFLPSCLAVAELARTLNSGTYFALPPMRDDQIREAVEVPARRVGFEVEPKLAERLVTGAADQAGRLPLLEHVLRELWQRRDEQGRALRFAAYTDAGGLDGAVAKAADRALTGLRKRLGERAPTVTRRLMTRLVHIGEGTHGDTRRRATLDELGRDEEARQVLETFVADARLLVSDEQDGVEVIEIAHEALLQEWQTLVGWLDADRGALRLRQDLARDANAFGEKKSNDYLWRKSRIDEARRILAGADKVELNEEERSFLERSVRVARVRTVGTLGAVAVVFVVLVGALFRQETALREREDALHREEIATAEAGESARLARAHELAAAEELGRSELMAGNPDRALMALTEVRRGGIDGSGVRQMLTEAARSLDAEIGRFEIEAGGRISDLAWSGDEILATTATGLWRVREHGPERIAEVTDGAIVWSRDRSHFALTGPDASLWETAGPRFVSFLEGGGATEIRRLVAEAGPKPWPALVVARESLKTDPRGLRTRVVFGPADARIATGSRSGEVSLFDGRDGTLQGSFAVHEGVVEDMVFSADGSFVFSVGGDGHLRRVGVDDGVIVDLGQVARAHSAKALVMTYGVSPFARLSTDASRLVVVQPGISAEVHDLTPTGGSIISSRMLPGADMPDPLTLLSLDDEAGFLLAGAGSGRVRMWQGERALPMLSAHASEITDVAVALEGSLLLSASRDGIRFWDISTQAPLLAIKGHHHGVAHFAHTDVSRLVATTDGIGEVAWWGFDSVPLRRRFEGVDPSSDAAAIRSLVCGGGDPWEVRVGVDVLADGSAMVVPHGNQIALYDTANGHELASWRVDEPIIDAHATGRGFMTHDCGQLLPHGGRAERQVRSWQPGAAGSLVLSADADGYALDETGERVAVADSGKITLWDLRTGSVLGTLKDARLPLRFLTDGVIASARSDRLAITLWTPSSNSQLEILVRGEGDWHFSEIHETEHLVVAEGRRETKNMYSSHEVFAWSRSGTIYPLCETSCYVATVHPDDAVVLVANDEIEVWTQATATRNPLPELAGRPLAIAVAETTGVVAALAEPAELLLWDRKFSLRHRLSVSINTPAVIAFDPDGARVAVGDERGRFVVIDVNNGKVIQHYGGGAPLTHAMFALAGARLVIRQDDGAVALWDVHLDERGPEELDVLAAFTNWRYADGALEPRIQTRK